MMSEAVRTGLTSAMGTPSGGRQCSTIMPLIGTSFPWGSCSKFLRRSVWKDKRQLSQRAESEPKFGLSMPIAFTAQHAALSMPPAFPFGNLRKPEQKSCRVQSRHSQWCSGHLLELQVSLVQFSWTVLPYPHCVLIHQIFYFIFFMYNAKIFRFIERQH